MRFLAYYMSNCNEHQLRCILEDIIRHLVKVIVLLLIEYNRLSYIEVSLYLWLKPNIINYCPRILNASMHYHSNIDFQFELKLD